MPANSGGFDPIPRTELMRELDMFAEEQLGLLTPVEKAWQPSDLLPDMASVDWLDQLQSCRAGAANLPDELLVTLVANMITEEALPSYHAWLANLESGFDRTGVGTGGMALWIRGWVGEEKRHGDVLARYLYATGRVDMRAVETTLQHLLRNGFDPLTRNCVIQGFIYTSFQERATFISHAGVARLARKYDDQTLAKICENVAGDEMRHEKAYERFVAHMFSLAPDETMLALEGMLRNTIIMPSRHMSDGQEKDLFTFFSAITQRNGIYTTTDYAKIMEHLVRLWKVETIPVTSSQGREAQDYVAALPARYLKLAERSETRRLPLKARPLSWLLGRVVGN